MSGKIEHGKMTIIYHLTRHVECYFNVHYQHVSHMQCFVSQSASKLLTEQELRMLRTQNLQLKSQIASPTNANEIT